MSERMAYFIKIFPGKFYREQQSN